MKEYEGFDIKLIIEEIEKHLETITHKSALEVMKILTDNKNGALKEISNEDWFIYYEIKLDELVFSEVEAWNTNDFERLYYTTIPMLYNQIKKAAEK